jgi:hypothetical protein
VREVISNPILLSSCISGWSRGDGLGGADSRRPSLIQGPSCPEYKRGQVHRSHLEYPLDSCD